jgi:hypothetical protein
VKSLAVLDLLIFLLSLEEAIKGGDERPGDVVGRKTDKCTSVCDASDGPIYENDWMHTWSAEWRK